DYQRQSEELTIDRMRGTDEIQTVRGEVVAVNYVPSRPRPRFEATIDDGTGKCALVWFNAGYIRNVLHPGSWVRVKGKVRFYKNIPQIVQPKHEMIEAEAHRVSEAKFHAVYPATENLPSDAIGRIIAQNLEA